jgi:choline monooxygenase
VCRYHGWSFQPDGLLRAARDFGGEVPADTRITPVRVHEWRGVVFVCLSEDTPGFDEWISEFAAACVDVPLERYRYHSRSTRMMRCNWKTYADNYLENYHVALVHPAMAQRDLVAKDARSHVGDRPNWSIQSATPREGGFATGMYTWRWPNFAFDVFPGGVAFERFVPISVDRTELVFDYFFDPDAVDVDDIVAASEVIVDEDVMIVEATQRNLASGVYRSGLLSPRHENGLAAFHALVDAAVGWNA